MRLISPVIDEYFSTMVQMDDASLDNMKKCETHQFLFSLNLLSFIGGIQLKK